MKSLFELISKPQTGDNSFYWPPLVTTSNGFIDWRWTAKDIKIFIDAFGEPIDENKELLLDETWPINGKNINPMKKNPKSM